MTDYCIDSAATGAADGTTWDDAFVSINAAIAGATLTGADRLLCISTHAATFAVNTSISFGTLTGLQLLSVASAGGANQTFTALATGAQESLTTSGDDWSLQGNIYAFGMKFIAGTSAGCLISLGSATSAEHIQVWDTCTFDLGGTDNDGGYSIGPNSTGTNLTVFIKLINCTMDMNNADNSIGFGVGTHEIDNLSLTGTAQTVLFNSRGNEQGGRVLVENCDFVASSDPTTLIKTSTRVNAKYTFRNIKTAAALHTLTSAIEGESLEVSFHNVNNVATPYQFQFSKYAGTINDDDAKYRDASDGTATISHVMVSNTLCSFQHPLYGDEIPIWNDGTTSITVTVKAAADNVSLNDIDVGVDFVHLSASGQGVRLSTHPDENDITDAGTGLTDTADDANWTWATPTDLKTYSFAKTFTPAQKGLIIARPWMRTASKTVRFNPLIEIS